MSTKAYMTVVRLVGMEGKPALSIFVDGSGRVAVTTDSDKSIEWFGCLVDWTFDSSLARKLAEALMACADESEVE